MRRILNTAALALLIGGCGGGDNKQPEPIIYSVEYVITGVFAGNNANVTYSNSTGGTEQKNVIFPGSIKYPFFPVGGFMYISAQNQTSSGSISVEIKVNDVHYKSATSTSAYGIATTSGSCCN